MKDRVCNVVQNRPGLTSREISQHLGIDMREWYPSDYIQPPLGFGGQPTVDANTANGQLLAVRLASSEPSSRTLCGVLKSMAELAAIREIRRLDLLAIEKAFSETEYAELSEALQIELVRRLEELKQSEARKQPQRSTGNLLMRCMVIGVALYGGMTLILKILHVLSK